MFKKENQTGTIDVILYILDLYVTLKCNSTSSVIYWHFRIQIFTYSVSEVFCTFLTLAVGAQCLVVLGQLTTLLACPLMSSLLTCLPPTIEWTNKAIYLSLNENF